MKMLCISCSNVLHRKDESASTKVCELTEEIAKEQKVNIDIETIRLSDYHLKNCIFCGRCMEDRRCFYDQDFNAIYHELSVSDRILLVVPFYSVIPSKLTMIMEKLNQLYYTAWLRDPDVKFDFSGKKVAVIGHGGSVLQDNPHAAQAYQDLLLNPLNYSLTSIGFNVIGLKSSTKGVVFGVEGYKEMNDAIFPIMIHNWKAIKSIISPLVINLLQYKIY
jgi:multimeric flavodoxin WrbA